MACRGNLKRARVEAPMPSLVRHPMPEVTVEDATPDPRPKKTYLDLLRFLLTMRRELATSEMHKYDGFLATMRALKDGRMDIAGLDTYVKALLAGHPELIRRFSEFLPWDYIRSQGPAAGGNGI
ncbi:unnamed protein product [Urochloa humidicola]